MEKFATKLARKADFDQGAERIYFGLKFEKKFYQKWFALFTAKAKINPFFNIYCNKVFYRCFILRFPKFFSSPYMQRTESFLV